jgi:hypothetical protein
MSNALLVALGQRFEFPLQLVHRRLISLPSALQVRPMSITVLGVRIRLIVIRDSQRIPQWSILIRDMLRQERRDSLPREFGR